MANLVPRSARGGSLPARWDPFRELQAVCDNAIRGEVKERERTGMLRRRTRRTGEFDHRVTLPGELDPDNVDAQLHDGVLTVRIAKPARAQPRRIEVKGG